MIKKNILNLRFKIAMKLPIPNPLKIGCPRHTRYLPTIYYARRRRTL